MGELLDDQQKFSLLFVMALKVLRSYLTLWARLQMTWVLTPPDLLAVPLDLLRGCRIVQEKLRIADSSIRYV
jgi:hypothetical protein